VRRSDWHHIETLFGGNGACGGCWCMTSRLPRGGKLYEACKGAPNRRRFRELLDTGKVHGLLAFSDAAPVGWCSVGPKSEYPRLENSRVLNVPRVGDDWTVMCFFIRRDWRKAGLATRMLGDAVEYAGRGGATLLDGFPVRPPGNGAIAPAFAWTGLPSMFEACGFRSMRDASRRPHYRIEFPSA
jgi:GNAT superfamily N-acetyltransferase